MTCAPDNELMFRARRLAADLDARRSMARSMIRLAHDLDAIVDDFRGQVDRIGASPPPAAAGFAWGGVVIPPGDPVTAAEAVSQAFARFPEVPRSLKGAALDAAAEAAYVTVFPLAISFDFLPSSERERWRDVVRQVEHFVQYPEPEADR